MNEKKIWHQDDKIQLRGAAVLLGIMISFLLFISDASMEGIWKTAIQEDGTAKITEYLGEGTGEIQIPDTVNGVAVTAIDSNVFDHLYGDVKIKIPTRIIHIAEDAFADTVDILAYNGSEALEYAKRQGLKYSNLSKLDFHDEIVDLSGIQVSSKGNKLVISETDALALEKGDTVYLAKDEGTIEAHTYVVEDISDKGEVAELSLKKRDGLDQVKSYHVSVQDEPVRNISFSPRSGNIVIENLKEFPTFTRSFDVTCNLAGVKTKVSIEYKATIDAQYDYEEGIGVPSGHFILNETITLKGKSSTDFSSSEKLKAQIEDIGQDIPSNEEPLANFVIPIGTTGLKITGSIGVDIRAALAGEIDYTIVRRRGYIWNGGIKQEINEPAYVDDAHSVLKAVGSLSVSVSGSLGMDIAFLADVARLEASAELGMTIAADSDQQYDPSIYCFDMEAYARFNLKATISLTVGVNTNFNLINNSLKATLIKKDFKMLDEKINLAKLHIEFHKSNVGGMRWLFLNQCSVPPELKRTIHLCSGTKEDLKDIKVLVGKTILKPAAPSRNGQNSRIQFLGWYTDPKEGEDFFKGATSIIATESMERETTLYARYTEPYQKIIIDLNDGMSEGPIERYQVSGTKLEKVFPPLRMNYRFSGFTYQNNAGIQEIWSFEEDVVPRHDLHLTGKWIYDADYDPFEEEVETLLADQGGWNQMLDDLVFQTSYSTGMIALVSHPNWMRTSVVAYCTGYNGHSSVVVIPDSYGMCPVVLVNGSNFQNKEKLTMLVLPSTVQYVTGFQDCPNLQVVIMKDNHVNMTSTANYVLEFDGIINIDSHCFQNCPKLTNVQFPRSGSLTTIDREAFDHTGVYEVKIPESVTSIGNQCFGNCANLKSVTLPQGITELPRHAFINCHNLSKLEGLDHITMLGEAALACTGFKHLRLYNLKRLDLLNFTGYPNLETLEVHMAEDGVAYHDYTIEKNPKLEDVLLDGFAAYITECGALRTLDMKANNKSIDMQTSTDIKVNLPSLRTLNLRGTWKTVCLVDFPELRSIHIEHLVRDENSSNDITKLPLVILTRIPKLTSLTIDDVGDGIPMNAGITGLQSVRYQMRYVGLSSLNLNNLRPSMEWSEFQHLDNLTSLVIPEGYEVIGQKEFMGNYALKTVSLPSTLKKINLYAFQNDRELKWIELPAALEEINYGAFMGTQIRSLTLSENNALKSFKNGFGSSLRTLILAREMDSFTIDSNNVPESISRITVLGDTELIINRYSIPESLFVIACSKNSPAWQAAESNGFLLLDLNSPEAAKRAIQMKVQNGVMFSEDSHIIQTGNNELGPRKSMLCLYEPGEVIILPTIYTTNGEPVSCEWREPIGNGYAAEMSLIADYDKILSCRVDSSSMISVTYEETAAGMIITGCTDEKLDTLVIPGSIFGKPVIGIADGALKGEMWKIVLPQSITSVSPLSFRRCKNLKYVEIYNNAYINLNGVVYAVDEKYNPTQLVFCPRGLKGILTIPEGVTEIADGAISGCSEIEKVVFPHSLTKIGNDNFSRCSGLTELLFPENLAYIEEGCLTGCENLNIVTFTGDCEPGITVGLGCNSGLSFYGPVEAERLTAWADENGKAYNLYQITFTDGDDLENSVKLSVRAGTSLDGYELEDLPEKRFKGWALSAGGDNVDTIPAEDTRLYANWQRVLYLEEDILLATTLETGEDLVIPYGVKEIAEKAVTVPIASAYIPSTVGMIAENAFMSVSQIIGDTDTVAEQYANEHGILFQEAVYTLTFESKEGSVCEPINAVANADIIMPVPIRNRAVFSGWYETEDCNICYTSTKMPDHNMKLYAGWDERWEARFLTSENDDGSLTITGYTGSDYELTIPEEIDGKMVTAVGASAFAMKEEPIIVTVPASVKYIGTGAFYGSEITTLIFEGDQISFAQGGLAGMYALTKLNLPSDQITIPENLLEGCKSLSDLIIPDTVRGIGKDAFNGCTFLRNLTLPSSLLLFDPGMFGNARIKNIYLSDINNNYIVRDACLYSGDGHTLLYVCPQSIGNTLQIPVGVTRLAPRSCAGLSLLSEVILPDTLMEIGNEAFIDCPMLRSIVIPASVGVIGDNLFGKSDLVIYTSSVNNAAYSLRLTYHVVVTGTQFVKAESIILDQEDATIGLGVSKQLIAQIAPSNATEQEIIWLSADGDIVSVDQNGVLTGVGEGTTTIQASTRAGITAFCEVTVVDIGFHVNLDLKSGSLSNKAITAEGKQCLFFNTDYVYYVSGSTNYTITLTSDSEYFYTDSEPSMNKQFKFYDSTSKLDGVPINIHIHGEGADGTFFNRDEVIYGCKKMRRSYSMYETTFFVGEIDTSLCYNDGFICKEGGYGIHISNPQIMELRENDDLQALKPGWTYISYRDDKRDWCQCIYVKENECDLQILAPKDILYDGQTMQLQVTCSDPDCTFVYEMWSNWIFEISDTGLITCNNPYGDNYSAEVSVKAMKGYTPIARASLIIKTGEAVTDLSLHMIYQECYDASTCIYNVKVKDKRNLLQYSSGAAESVIFTTSDASIMSVTKDGIATALRPGNVVLGYILSNGTTDQITINVSNSSLRTLSFPASLKTLDEEVFRGNNMIQRVIFGEQVVRVEAYAFADCCELKEVEFLNGDCFVDETAFSNCNEELVFYCPTGSMLEDTLKNNGWIVNP